MLNYEGGVILEVVDLENVHGKDVSVVDVFKAREVVPVLNFADLVVCA